MHEQLKKKQRRVAGYRQVMKGMGEDSLSLIFLAMDAGPGLQMEIRTAANERQLAVEMVSTMEELGQMCRIEVPCAVAALKKQGTE